MEQNEKKLNEIDQKVTSILQILKGHELNRDDKGLIGDSLDHEERITKLERWRKSIFYVVIGASAGSGYALSDLIATIFGK